MLRRTCHAVPLAKSAATLLSSGSRTRQSCCGAAVSTPVACDARMVTLSNAQRFCGTSSEAATAAAAAATAAAATQPPSPYGGSGLPPAISRARLRALRHMLEGRDPRGVPPPKFNGYFDDPNDVPGSYTPTVRELEKFVQELESHRTYEELADMADDATDGAAADDQAAPPQQQVDGRPRMVLMDPEDVTEYEATTNKMDGGNGGGSGAANPNASSTQKAKNNDEGYTPHPDTRSAIVSDAMERKLLFSFAVFRLNFEVEPPGTKEPTTRSVDPNLYMKYVAGGIGFHIARGVLNDLVREEAPLHPEVCRYLAEFGLVLNDAGVFTQAGRIARGAAVSPEQRRLAQETGRLDELEEAVDTCSAAVINSCGDFIIKKCVVAILEGDGEGDAVRATFGALKSMLPHLPGELQEPLLRSIIDRASLLYKDSTQRREDAHDEKTNKREHVRQELDAGAEVMLQSAAAMLKAIAATECANVVDKSGALHFDMLCNFFSLLDASGRRIEATGVAEAAMRFYDTHKKRLEAEYERRKLLVQNDEEGAAAEKKENEAADAAAAAELEELEREDPETAALVKRREHNRNAIKRFAAECEDDDPAATTAATQFGNPFEMQYRIIFFEWLSLRARSDPSSGLYKILEACGKYPKSAELFKLLSLCLFRLERWEDALNAIDRSILLNPINPESHRMRGYVLYKLKEFLTAEREHYLAEVLFDVMDGVRDALSPSDILHATGPLLVEAEARRDRLHKETTLDHNGDPETRPRLPGDLCTALQLTQLADPRTGQLISPAAGALISELLAITLPDTEIEMKHYMNQMRRHHMYSVQQGSVSATMRLNTRPLKIGELYATHREMYRDQVAGQFDLDPENVPDSL